MLLVHGRNLCTRSVSTSSAFLILESRRLIIKSPLVAISRFRFLSTKDVFGGIDYSNINIPDCPVPPPPKPSAEELYATGKSVLTEMGCFSWITPPSYLRVLMEQIHNIPLPLLDMDIPWWGAIFTVTCVLRLLSCPVMVMSRKTAALMQKYKPELDAFNERTKIAKAEGNNLLVQQIVLEQMDFFKAKNIKHGKQAVVLLCNAMIFFCQYRAVAKLAEVGYPGFSTGGMLWFMDLTQADYIIPIFAALMFHLAVRTGLETGGAYRNVLMKFFLLYGAPIGMVALNYGYLLFSPIGIPSAIWVHVCANSTMTLMYAGLFKIPSFCNFVGLPYTKPEKNSKNEWQELAEWWRDRKSAKKASIDPGSLRQQDLRAFESAGRKRPVIKK